MIILGRMMALLIMLKLVKWKLKVVDLVMKWVVKLVEMDRSQQVGLVMVMCVLGVRNCLLEIEGWGWRPCRSWPAPY